MSNKQDNSKSPLDTLKSESARQRWELFHRAIAHAKASNDAALIEAEAQAQDAESAPSLLSIVR